MLSHQATQASLESPAVSSLFSLSIGPTISSIPPQTDCDRHPSPFFQSKIIITLDNIKPYSEIIRQNTKKLPLSNRFERKHLKQPSSKTRWQDP